MAAAVQLGPVQETLLVPLYMRAVETQRTDAIIHDPQAVEIVSRIPYDFQRLELRDAWLLQLALAIRTEIFDEVVRNFLAKHPQGTVVNLAAGLDSRFWRTDNGQMHWFDVDLPDAMELRRQYFSESERNRFITGSALESDWIDQVDREGTQPVLILAEGLLMYLEESDVRDLLAMLARRFPGSDFVFESIAPRLVGKQETVPGLRSMSAPLRWGLASVQELREWGPQYEPVADYAYIDRRRHHHRWRVIRWLKWLPWIYRDLKQVFKVSHVRFQPCPQTPASSSYGEV